MHTHEYYVSVPLFCPLPASTSVLVLEFRSWQHDVKLNGCTRSYQLLWFRSSSSLLGATTAVINASRLCSAGKDRQEILILKIKSIQEEAQLHGWIDNWEMFHLVLMSHYNLVHCIESVMILTDGEQMSLKQKKNQYESLQVDEPSCTVATAAVVIRI